MLSVLPSAAGAGALAFSQGGFGGKGWQSPGEMDTERNELGGDGGKREELDKVFGLKDADATFATLKEPEF